MAPELEGRQALLIVGHPGTGSAGLLRGGLRFTFGERRLLWKSLRRAPGLLAGVDEGLAATRSARGTRPPVFHVDPRLRARKTPRGICTDYVLAWAAAAGDEDR